jgi:tRNA threonylcarbamoyladenosine biosynthesis protein TsaE
MVVESNNENETKAIGEAIGTLLRGGEIIELIGDVGSGKTTLVKGIAVGLGIDEYVQSPSFTISRMYQGRDDIKLAHYDFYRLNEAGIMANELHELANDDGTAIIIEWAGVVEGILPIDRLSITINAIDETSRRLVLASNGENSRKLMKQLKL